MKVLIVAAALLVASPAFAETVSEETGVNAALKIAPTTNDFVSEAAISGMFEIQSSTLAESKLTGSGKDFAEQMITDHTKIADELSAQAKADNVPVPTALDSTHQKMLDKLKSLNEKDFAKQYFNDQVSAHKSAVNLFERYGKGGKDAKLKDWASSTLPTLQHHLQMAEGLDKSTS